MILKIYIRNIESVGCNMNEKRLIKLFAFSSIILIIVDFLFGAFYYMTMTLKDITPAQIAFFMSVSSLTLIIADFPSGNISDIIGRKKTAGIGKIIWGAGLIGFSLVTSYYQFLIIAVVINVGVALDSGSLSVWVHDYLMLNNREEIWKEIQVKLATLKNFFNFFFNILFLFIYYIFDLNVLLYAGSALVLTGIYNLLEFKGEDNYGERNTTLFKSILMNFKYIFKTGSMRKIILIEFLDGILIPTLILTLPFKLISVIGIEVENIPFIYIFLTFFMFMASIILKRVLAKYNIKQVYIFNLITTATAIGLFLLVDNLIVIVFSLFLYEVAIVFNFVTKGTWKYEYFESFNKASVVSAVSACGSVASALYFSVVGLLLTQGSVGLVILAALNIVNVLVKFYTFRTLNK